MAPSGRPILLSLRMVSMAEIDDAVITVNDGTPVQPTVMYFPQSNDVQVTVQYPTIADGTGCQSEFYYKDNRFTPDDDPTTVSYTVSVNPDPDNAGATMSTFVIEATDNGVNGAFWWRVDFVDSAGDRSTVGFGTLIVEAV